MDERREFVSFASREGANKSALCERFGISRQTGYKWLARSRLPHEDFQDRSRRPLRQPNRTSEPMEAAVVEVRDAHPAWGARKIACCLERAGLTPPAVSTIHAVLERHGRIACEARRQHCYKRFEKAAPNQLWQMDFKGGVHMDGPHWCHPLTVIDDHSRFAVSLEACADECGTTVKPLLVKAFRRYGLPQAFYVDNGAPWGGSAAGTWTRFGVWLLKLGIELINGRPYHPQGRGKIERFHRTLNAEIFMARPITGLDLSQLQSRFDEWRMVYNMDRPHEALDMQVPANRYQPSQRPFPQQVPDIEYDSTEIVRRVDTTKGFVSFKNRRWRVPSAFTGEWVAIRPRTKHGLYGIFFGATRIATIDLTT